MAENGFMRSSVALIQNKAGSVVTNNMHASAPGIVPGDVRTYR